MERSFKTNDVFNFQKAWMRVAVLSVIVTPYYAYDLWFRVNDFNRVGLIFLLIFSVYRVYIYYKVGVLKFDRSFFSNN